MFTIILLNLRTLFSQTAQQTISPLFKQIKLQLGTLVIAKLVHPIPDMCKIASAYKNKTKLLIVALRQYVCTFSCSIINH